MSKIYDALRKSQAERRLGDEERLAVRPPSDSPPPPVDPPEPPRTSRGDRDRPVVELPSLDRHHRGFWLSMERVAAAVQSWAGQQSRAARRGRSVLFAGVEPASGTTTVSLFTATLLVRDPGVEVLLIDAHARENGRVMLPRGPGLVQLALGEATIDEVISPTDRKGLSYLSRGFGSYNGPKLVERITPHLAELRQRFDFLILDSAPVTVAPEAAQLAGVCDGVVVVLTSERTARSEAKRTREILEQHDATILGTVINQARRSSI